MVRRSRRFIWPSSVRNYDESSLAGILGGKLPELWKIPRDTIRSHVTRRWSNSGLFSCSADGGNDRGNTNARNIMNRGKDPRAFPRPSIVRVPEKRTWFDRPFRHMAQWLSQLAQKHANHQPRTESTSEDSRGNTVRSAKTWGRSALKWREMQLASNWISEVLK